ncbi:pentapeptide repeat-containing protein [Kitasatospora sp. NPDC048286]|uniref:pentapeptide repeat-containing protein n=1 Tax=Kitasatospora sp. NPDC048286 TaxID=3364047 RepID=UPI003717B688
MTTSLSAVDAIRLALAASPRPQFLGQGSASSSPWWVSLVSGLGGALIGGGIAGLTAWVSGRRQLQHERARLLNERFATASELLGHTEAANRLAGVHAMAGLADDWAERRQTCIDVLCAYLRMPYPAEPPETKSTERMAWQANREVRHTVIRVIRDHLKEEVGESATSWEGHDFDFTGTVFDGGTFHSARFTGGTVSFFDATFSDSVNFDHTEFSGAIVDFASAKFSRGTVNFAGAKFSGGTVWFTGTEFSGGIVRFVNSEFSSSEVNFTGARFSRGAVWFSGAKFSGGMVDLQSPAVWTAPPVFDDAVQVAPPTCLLLPSGTEPPQPGVPAAG